MERLFFICFEVGVVGVGGQRKKTQEGVKLAPGGPRLPNVPCCTAANGIKTRLRSERIIR